MTTMKGWISTTVLAAALTMSATSINAGIIVGNATGSNDTCFDRAIKIDWGIIVGNLGGIIVGNLTGIIVGNATTTSDYECVAYPGS